MKTKMIVLLTMLAASTGALAETRVSVGIHVGSRYGYGYYEPAPPPPVYVYETPCPGPDYMWVPGYWYGAGPRHFWRRGYWAPRGYHGGHRGVGYGVYDNPGHHYGWRNTHRGHDRHGWKREFGRDYYRHGRR
jgi:hypothetical protein